MSGRMGRVVQILLQKSWGDHVLPLQASWYSVLVSELIVRVQPKLSFRYLLDDDCQHWAVSLRLGQSFELTALICFQDPDRRLAQAKIATDCAQLIPEPGYALLHCAGCFAT